MKKIDWDLIQLLGEYNLTVRKHDYYTGLYGVVNGKEKLILQLKKNFILIHQSIYFKLPVYVREYLQGKYMIDMNYDLSRKCIKINSTDIQIIDLVCRLLVHDDEEAIECSILA